MTIVYEITKIVEFDAGHRVPSHNGKCRNAHGHRYRVEATLRGPVHVARGRTDDGMVADFSVVKSLMMRDIHDEWDHAFLVWNRDELMMRALLCLGGDHRSVVLGFVPTAENLACEAFRRLDASLREEFNEELALVRVRVYETPGSWADAIREET